MTADAAAPTPRIRRSLSHQPTAARRATAGRRPRLRRRAAVLFGVAAVVLVAAFATSAALLQVARHDRDRLLDRLDPALQQLNAYETALVGESTGARGYTLSGDTDFLALYRQSVADADTARPALDRDIPSSAAARQQLGRLDRSVSRWRTAFVVPEVTQRVAGKVDTRGLTGATVGLAEIHQRFAVLQADLSAQRHRGVQSFDRALTVLESVVGAVFLGMAVLLLALWLAIRRAVLRPLVAVSDDSRRVTAGELDHPVGVVGPAEIAELAESIEAMRSAVVDDLHAIETAHAELARQERALAERSEELARSNRDLEQFAYVASHDLQEPLRKVASFCQLLADRYGDQLDDRGGQYIDFAVDGAKRMQALVNDLLAFSRVGRTRDAWAEVDLGRCLDAALANLERRINEAGGRVEVTDPLPTVVGDRSLLVALWQNLIGNSIKFRADDPPVVAVSCGRDGDRWWLSVGDNGIGIEPEYADRVFTIFQRLHSRERYEGTGIGLALCRRIVEFHGGTIDVEPRAGAGTLVRFTLPVVSHAEDVAPDGAAPEEENVDRGR